VGNVVGPATMPSGCAAVQPMAPAALAAVVLSAVVGAQPLTYRADNAAGTPRFAASLTQGLRGSRTAGVGSNRASLTAAGNVSACPLGCCGRGFCGASGCRCVNGWHGPACGTTPAVWVAAINKRRLRLIAEARGRHSQAEKSLSLAEMLRNTQMQMAGSTGYSAALAQAQLLERDVQALASAAEASERQAHDPALQPEMQDLVQAGGALAVRSCAVVAPRAPDHTRTLKATHLLGAPGRPALLALRKKQPQEASGNSDHFQFYTPQQAMQSKQGEVQVNLSSKDFGVEGDNLPTKSKSDEKSGCQDNCNFRGLCEDGVCFCQPGYYGRTCDIVAESEKDTLSLVTCVFIAGAMGALSFLMTALFMLHKFTNLRKAETEQLIRP